MPHRSVLATGGYGEAGREHVQRTFSFAAFTQMVCATVDDVAPPSAQSG